MTKEGNRESFSAVEVLDFVAAGLGGLPHRIGRIEALAAPLAKGAPRDGELRVALQDLDHIRQIVDDLARLASTARTSESHSAATLASTLRLEALRNLLFGVGQEEMPGAKVENGHGRIEFFAADLDSD